MLSRGTSLIFSAAAFICLILLPPPSFAQTGSVYFSVGYNKAWYSPSTIRVSQSQIGNSYDLIHVKADNKTQTPISAFQLNYRLGYYFNYDQTLGIEFNYDPVNYHVSEGQSVELTGMVNSIPKVNKKIIFSSKNGYVYKYDGANLMLLNVVRRIQVYHTNNRRIRADLVLKGGIGPVMPHVQNSLPVDAIDNPQLEWGGWNVGVETALRVTIYKYGFLEVAGKYDFAAYSGINTYQGTASQRLSTYESIASIGFTLPTTKHNPLFYHQTVITLIPLFVDKKDKEDKQAATDSSLTEDIHPMADIPEFAEIAERDEKHRFRDSLALAMRTYYDSASVRQRQDSVNIVKGDSLAIFRVINPDSTTVKSNDSGAIKGVDATPVKTGGTENVDSLENALMQQGSAPKAPASAVQPVLSKKEQKKLEKHQKREKKALEKQQELNKKNKEAEEKAAKDKADTIPKPESTDADKKDTSVPNDDGKKETPPPADPDKKDPAPPDTPPAGKTDNK